MGNRCHTGNSPIADSHSVPCNPWSLHLTNRARRTRALRRELVETFLCWIAGSTSFALSRKNACRRRNLGHFQARRRPQNALCCGAENLLASGSRSAVCVTPAAVLGVLRHLRTRVRRTLKAKRRSLPQHTIIRAMSIVDLSLSLRGRPSSAGSPAPGNFTLCLAHFRPENRISTAIQAQAAFPKMRQCFG